MWYLTFLVSKFDTRNVNFILINFILGYQNTYLSPGKIIRENPKMAHRVLETYALA